MNLINKISAIIPYRKYICVVTRKMDTNSWSNSETWRGVPISEILGTQSPWSTPEFPLVTPAYNHTVLYQVSHNGTIPMDSPPKPHISPEKWDHDYVRMPCSSQSLYPIEDSNGKTHLKKRWEIIQESLQKSIHNSKELADVILSYNTKFKNIWKFRSLHRLLNDHIETEEADMFFKVTLPQIAKLALALPKLVQSPIPLLKQHKNHSVSLSQQQIACLLANAFFCTFPRRNTSKRTSEYYNYPHINFTTLFEASPSDSVLEKLKCLCNYFRRVCTKVPVGVLSVSRRSVPSARLPAWAGSARALAAVPLHVDSSATIEDAHGLIQFDFANKYLGGGVLGHGCVQEEIRFVICPELFITMLFTEVMKPDEALIIIGCERYSNYSGYGNSFHFTGNYEDNTPFDSSGRRRTVILAVDALPFSDERVEFKPSMITRELNKAWVGVSFALDAEPARPCYPGVATGNWGCGAFGGTPQLKALLQLMACAQAGRPMAYYTFGDARFRDDLLQVYNVLTRHHVTVGQLYKYMTRFSQATDVTQTNFHKYLLRLFKEGGTGSSSTPKETVVMEISDSADVSLTNSIEREFNNSPDLFTEDDSPDLFITEQNDKSIKKTESSIKSEQKTDASIKNEASTSVSGNSRLFDEMEKFDATNGQLNLTSPNKHTSIVDSDDSIRLDLTTEVKRKISKKITDYFSKKSI